ncbi:MAG: hypothetical protein HY360_12510 [Verrucomicrobia bacterium]|nr:hypothetical protein [Verrucomicrobiota bacterium]
MTTTKGGRSQSQIESKLQKMGRVGFFLTTAAFMHVHDAIRCLRAGKHVLSEVAACWTMAEAVALHEAAHASNHTYMPAENYSKRSA